MRHLKKLRPSRRRARESVRVLLHRYAEDEVMLDFLFGGANPLDEICASLEAGLEHPDSGSWKRPEGF